MRPLAAGLFTISLHILVQVLLPGSALASGEIERVCAAKGGGTCSPEVLGHLLSGEYAPAERLAARSCDDGNLADCYLVGLAGSIQGKIDLTLRSYTRACDGGLAAVCPVLGDLLILGVRKNEPGWTFARGWTEALVLFERACDLSDGYGCARAATVYGGGLGVPPQPERAAQLRRKACALGDDEACARLD